MRALVLGGGECVWEDLRRLEEEMLGGEWDGIVVAANDVAVHWPRKLDALVSLHPDRIKLWVTERTKAGYPAPGALFSRHNLSARFRETLRPAQNWGGGSSGMLAVAVAQGHLGAQKIVLCGVPMTATPHFAESHTQQRGKKWHAARTHFRAWLREKRRMQGLVRSMSGRTRELLGEPTPRWLEGGHE